MRFFLEAAGGQQERPFAPHTRIVSIGPITSATLREHGLEPHVEARQHDVDGIVAGAARRRRGRWLSPRELRLGSPRVHLRVTDSTNERARALALAAAPHGTLVTAEEQTAGRGRQGRRWFAPPRSALLMSLLLRTLPPLLPLAAAVAVCDVAGRDAGIKWPNDVVVAEPSGSGERGLAKLGGILAEGRPQEGWLVLGIGLNVAVALAELPAQLRGATEGGLPAATMGRSPRSSSRPSRSCWRPSRPAGGARAGHARRLARAGRPARAGDRVGGRARARRGRGRGRAPGGGAQRGWTHGPRRRRDPHRSATRPA